MNQLVSIIIPVYNRVHLVSKAIESAINQTYTNIEVIICDNCSNDGTWKLLQDYSTKDSRIRIFRNIENIGPVRNWKRCVDEAKGYFIKFIFSDDWIDSDWIEKAIKPFADNNIGFSFSPAEILTENRAPLNSYNWFTEDKIIASDYYIFLNYFKANNPVSPCCALFRKTDVIKNLLLTIDNPLEIDFAQHGGGIDLLLFLYTAKQYKRVSYINTTKVYFRGESDSISIKQNLDDSYLYAKIYFINGYKSFSSFFCLKLYLNRNNLIKYLKPSITFKDLKALLFFIEKTK